MWVYVLFCVYSFLCSITCLCLHGEREQILGIKCVPAIALGFPTKAVVRRKSLQHLFLSGIENRYTGVRSGIFEKMTTLIEIEERIYSMEVGQWRETPPAVVKPWRKSTLPLDERAFSTMVATAAEESMPCYTLKLPAYRGNGPPNAYLAQVRLAAHSPWKEKCLIS